MEKKSKIKVRNLLVKDPFLAIQPYIAPERTSVVDGQMTYVEDDPTWNILTQADFLRELYVSGHKILDDKYYPDEYVQVDINGKKEWVRKLVSRVTVPFQLIIKVQRNIHLCGNDTVFSLSNQEPSEEDKALFANIKQLWLDKNMEICKFQNIDSFNCTGDTATLFYFAEEEGKKVIKWKVYSYLDKYKIYCHMDQFTNKPKVFAVEYKQCDEENNAITSFVDVYDESNFYRFKKDLTGAKKIINKIAEELFGLDSYELIEQKPHGFKRCPVEYRRSRIGACWTPSQNNIEQYEKGLSQFCDNSKVLGTAMVFIKGSNAEIEGMSTGQPFAITSSDPNADAKILNKSDISNAFTEELKVLKDTILMGSFSVVPPEIRSGDLPGVAIKLIYSPSLEKAMEEAREWDAFIDGLMELFLYGAGIELECSSRLKNLKITGRIEPYIHENTAEKIQNLVISKQAGITSTETASQKMPYNSNYEYEIIRKERDEQIRIEQQGMAQMINPQQ